MLPTKLAFVDIETTGTRSRFDRIIEIGIILVDEGELIETYSTLINPSSHIPSQIEAMTGITAKALENAPPFSQIAPDIIDKLKDYTFVAHNVRFDYGFIKAEFARLGITFSTKHFCTVRLSRALYPTLPRHNLDTLIERFNLVCENRHRALDDALAIYSFYQKAQAEIAPYIFTKALQAVLKKPYLPLKLDAEILEALPESPGVYIFYGPKPDDSSMHVPLYIGKSINIKNRILSHFSDDIHSPVEMKIAQQIKSIETVQTTGELGALFLESEMIKKELPLYNRMLRRKQELVALKQYKNDDGYYSIHLDTIQSPTVEDLPDLVGLFRSRKQAKDFLSQAAKEHQLCEKLLELEKTSLSCFAYRLERCKGACLKKELSLSYNLRFLEAFGSMKIKRWPYGTAIIIEETNLIGDKTEYFLIDQWCFLGTVHVDSYGSYHETDREHVFDLDTYKILVRYLSNPKNERHIKPATIHQQSPFL